MAHGSPVRVTLRAGETLSHFEGGPTDEGYSSECSEWYYDAAEGLVFCEYTSWSRDCDGPHESQSETVCPASRLALGPEFDGLRYPDWDRIGSRQRDYFAEAAGY